jgi:uncharacterized membrane protein (DUF2068 family)
LEPSEFGCVQARLPEGLFDDIMKNYIVTSLRNKKRKRGNTQESSPSGVVRLIAAFKLFKGLVLFAVGIGAAKLLHKDLGFEVERWADIFRVDPNNHFIHRLLEKFLSLDARKLKELSVGTFFYSALLLTEGTGLLLGKRWAEYFTIFATSSFIPLEVYEIARHVSTPKLVLLVLNVIIVVYLVFELRRKLKDH